MLGDTGSCAGLLRSGQRLEIPTVGQSPMSPRVGRCRNENYGVTRTQNLINELNSLSCAGLSKPCWERGFKVVGAAVPVVVIKESGNWGGRNGEQGTKKARQTQSFR